MTLDNIFERHGYGLDGVKRPDADLHAVETAHMTLVDELRISGIFVAPEDAAVLNNPERYGAFGEATVRDYEIQRQLLTVAGEDSIIPSDWQQTA